MLTSTAERAVDFFQATLSFTLGTLFQPPFMFFLNPICHHITRNNMKFRRALEIIQPNKNIKQVLSLEFFVLFS